MSKMGKKQNQTEEALTLGLSLSEIEEKLGSPEHLHVAKLVNKLPDEEVSLVWRSQLNERLLTVSRQLKRRQRLIWVWRPALGLGLAGLVAIVLVLPRGGQSVESPAPKPSVEAALVKAHHDTVLEDDVAGIGLNPADVDDNSNADGGSQDSL